VHQAGLEMIHLKVAVGKLLQTLNNGYLQKGMSGMSGLRGGYGQ